MTTPSKLPTAGELPAMPGDTATGQISGGEPGGPAWRLRYGAFSAGGGSSEVSF